MTGKAIMGFCSYLKLAAGMSLLFVAPSVLSQSEQIPSFELFTPAESLDPYAASTRLRYNLGDFMDFDVDLNLGLSESRAVDPGADDFDSTAGLYVRGELPFSGSSRMFGRLGYTGDLFEDDRLADLVGTSLSLGFEMTLSKDLYFAWEYRQQLERPYEEADDLRSVERFNFSLQTSFD